MYKNLTFCVFIATLFCAAQAEAQNRNWYLLPYRANVAHGGYCYGASGMAIMPSQQLTMMPSQQFSTGGAQFSLATMAAPSYSMQYNLASNSGFQNQLNFDNPVASNGLFGGNRLIGGGNSVELIRIASCLACKILSNGSGSSGNTGGGGLPSEEIDVNAQLSLPVAAKGQTTELAKLEARVAKLEKNMLTSAKLEAALNKILDERSAKQMGTVPPSPLPAAAGS
jgi:hypothetical protein